MDAFTTPAVVRHSRRMLTALTPSILRTVAYGLAGSAAAVGFLVLSAWLYQLLFVSLAERSFALFCGGSLAVVVVSSLLVGILLAKLQPDAAGSGIPQLKTAYWNESGFISWRAACVKFVAGVLSLGGGASLGREGPTVYMSAAAASSAARLSGTAKPRLRPACVAGAGAGLAAAFNTPLAAITFVLEEVVGDLNSRLLGSVVLAAVVGAFVVQAVLGPQPAFVMPLIETVSWRVYVAAPVVAAAAALAGVAFHRLALSWRGRIRRRSRIPAWLRPLVGGLMTWAIGVAVFRGTGRIGIFGLGYLDLSEGLVEGIAWRAAAILVAGKLLATVASYAWGGCGGIFSPTLFIGAMAGFAVAGLAGQWLPLSNQETLVLAAVGMGACFAAVVRAPLTTILMVFEMTHQFAMVPPLMIGTLVSLAVARLAGRANFYEALLDQDGFELGRLHPPRDLGAWQGQPVSALANRRPIVLRDLDPQTLRNTLAGCPFAVFPVERDGVFRGVADREAIETALRAGVPPALADAATCLDSDPVGEVAGRMVAATTPVAVLLDRPDGRVTGIVTMHDLLRAQLSLTE